MEKILDTQDYMMQSNITDELKLKVRENMSLA